MMFMYGSVLYETYSTECVRACACLKMVCEICWTAPLATGTDSFFLRKNFIWPLALLWVVRPPGEKEGVLRVGLGVFHWQRSRRFWGSSFFFGVVTRGAREPARQVNCV